MTPYSSLVRQLQLNRDLLSKSISMSLHIVARMARQRLRAIAMKL